MFEVVAEKPATFEQTTSVCVCVLGGSDVASGFSSAEKQRFNSCCSFKLETVF